MSGMKGHRAWIDEIDQMEFTDVVESEPVPGDPSYTAWLAAGKPPVNMREPRPTEEGRGSR